MRFYLLLVITLLLCTTACHSTPPAEQFGPTRIDQPTGDWTLAKYFNMLMLGHYESLSIRENGDVEYKTGGRSHTYIFTGRMVFHDDGFVDVAFDRVRFQSPIQASLNEHLKKKGKPIAKDEHELAYQSRKRWAIDRGGWLMFISNDSPFAVDDPPEELANFYKQINLSLFKPIKKPAHDHEPAR